MTVSVAFILFGGLLIGGFLLGWAVIALTIYRIVRAALVRLPLVRSLVSVPLALVLIWIPLWRFFPGLWLAEAACERDGGVYSPKPVVTEGYFRAEGLRYDENQHIYPAAKIIDDLVVRKFRFIEEAATNSAYPGFLRDEVAGESGDVVRFYLDLAGAPACQSFQRKLSQDSGFRNAMRMKGLPDTLCIATARSDERQSEYSLARIDRQTGFPAFIHWQGFVVTHEPTHREVAKFTHFGYYSPFFPRFDVGGTSCRNREAQSGFVDAVFTPAETVDFLVKRGIPKDSPLMSFYDSADHDAPTRISDASE